MVGLGLTAGLMLGACRTDREITRPDPEPVTADNVADALLTVEDLPAGFTAADEGTEINAELVPEHECDDALGGLEPEEVASADFTGSGVTLTNTVAWFPGAGGAVEQLLRDVAAACRQAVAADEGISVRTGGLDFGVLSDDTVAIRFEVEPTSGPIQERDIVLRREGDLVSITRLEGLRPSDKALLDTAVRVSIGRLGALAQAANPT